MPGSPDIAAAILRKIDSASMFVGDVSIIATSAGGRPCPNPNVLIEFGYALKSLGADNVILVCNTAFGSVAELPFDLKGKRIAPYSLGPDEEPATKQEELAALFREALADIARHQRRSRTYQRNTEFATDLVSALVRVQLFGNEVEERRVDPWLGQILDVFAGASQWLKQNSHQSAVADLELMEPMERLAFALDKVRDHDHGLGGGGKFTEKVMAATRAAAELQATIRNMGPLTEEAVSEITRVIVDQEKQLTGWVRRTMDRDLHHSERYRDFISEVKEIGYQLGTLSYYPLEGLEGEPAKRLRKIGESLHLVDLKDSTSHHRGRDAIVSFVADNAAELRSLILGLRLEK